MTSTEQYIEYLTRMKSGELGLLRKHRDRVSMKRSTALICSRACGGRLGERAGAHLTTKWPG